MRVRFLESVSVPGGPRYHAGEVVEIDRFQLTEAFAQRCIRERWAEVVSVSVPPAATALDASPIDRMVRRPNVKK